MSLSKEEKEVIMDFDGAIEIMKNRGRRINLKTVAGEIGYTEVGLAKIRKSAPKSIKMLFHFLKDNMLRFEDVVKEVQPKKQHL